MAPFKKIIEVEQYIGLSTDTKPAVAPIGSTCYETDTKATYVWDGTAWRLK